MNAQPVSYGQTAAIQGHLRILIVDDDPDVLASLKDVLELEFADCSIEQAGDVSTAIELAGQTMPDIALLDIKIGQDNGLDLIPALKKLKADIACIMMTAWRDNQYTVTAVRFGANDYLYKPIEPVTLIRAIERLYHQQQLNREVKKAESRFHAVFDQAFQWLFLTDLKGDLMEANETALEFAGQTKSEIVGMTLWESPWWASSPAAQEILRQGLADVNAGDMFLSELDVWKSEQGWKTLEVSMKPVLDGAGNIGQVVMECRDITDRKRAEEKIRTLNAGLEKRVKERTLALEDSIQLLEQENEQRKQAESSLVKARVQAEQANQAKTEFMSRMSHELRTPMNAILGFSQILKEDGGDPLTSFQEKMLDEVLKAGFHLLDLINEVLDIARIESGKFDPDMKPVSMSVVIQDCLSILEPLRGDQNILVNVDETISSTDCKVLADNRLLKQSVLNLVTNAIKYNREMGEVRLSCERIQPGRMRLSVSDKGDGISPENQKLLFQPFERLGRDSKVEGSGIGLTVVKSLVEAMEGNVGVSSIEGEGSTFWIELELAGAE